MEAPKSLRKPIHWQDFESLCKNLWGEIWSCPEIKKNGREGQSQNGVDIYGIPFGERGYYGIQCKGKDEYTHKKFSKAEISYEVTQALNFQPPLKKLYFATTAEKDVKIEEYVRLLNLEHVSSGLFEIHIFCWEDIVDLIQQNKQTYSWYLNKQNYTTKTDALVTFTNGSAQAVFKPLFKKWVKIGDRNYWSMGRLLFNISPLGIATQAILPAKNLSYIHLPLLMKNIGQLPLKDLKIRFSFFGEIVDLSNSNMWHILNGGMTEEICDLIVDKKKLEATFFLRDQILPGDTLAINNFFFKTQHRKSRVLLLWELSSNEIIKKGELHIDIEPEIRESKVFTLRDKNLELGGISDYITIF